MHTYHINVDTIHIQAKNEEEAQEKYAKMIEDPETTIGILKEFSINEEHEM